MISLMIIFFNFLIKAFSSYDLVNDVEALGYACFSELILEGIVSVLLFSFKLKNNEDKD